MFRSYKETGKLGLRKINVALKIHSMIMGAIHSHPDIQRVKRPTEMMGKLEEEQNQMEEELEALRKVRRLRKTRTLAGDLHALSSRFLKSVKSICESYCELLLKSWLLEIA